MVEMYQNPGARVQLTFIWQNYVRLGTIARGTVGKETDNLNFTVTFGDDINLFCVCKRLT